MVTYIGLVLPFVSLGLPEGFLRFSFIYDSTSHARIVSTTVITVVISIFIFTIINSIINKGITLNTYSLLQNLLLITTLLNTLTIMLSQVINKMELIAFSGIINALTVFVFTIFCYMIFGFGANEYITALCVGNIGSSTFLILKNYGSINIRISLYDKKLLFKMLKYSLPLVPNAVSWWINHTSNRYVINYYFTSSDVGIFSAAYKIPSILILFYSIFNQAWQLSAFKVQKNIDEREFYRIVFENYSMIVVISTTIIMTFSQQIINVMLGPEFQEAIRYSPLLILSSTFGAFVGFYSAIFLAKKSTAMLLLSTILGAGVTLVLNILLTPIFGPIGSAYSSAIAYLSIWAVLEIIALNNRYISHTNIKLYFTVCLLFLQSQLFLINNENNVFYLNLSFNVIIIFLFKDRVTKTIGKIRNLIFNE